MRASLKSYQCSSSEFLSYCLLLLKIITSFINHTLFMILKFLPIIMDRFTLATNSLPQPIKPPYIDLQVSTWAKDSHALYDYEAGQDTKSQFKTQSFYINRNCRLYRHVTSMKTIIIYDDHEQKEQPLQNIYICSIKKDIKNDSFHIESADISKVEPPASIAKDHPDIFRNSYVVLRDFEKDAGIEGYPLECGNFVKLGRAEFLVIEVKGLEQINTLRETAHLELNTGTHVVPEEALKGSCKICLCEQDTPEDPLIAPCKCRGSCELVHSNCLKKWIDSKVKRELTDLAISYNFSKFECEICKTLLPKTVELFGGKQVEMIAFTKPEKPYIVLESYSEKHERREELKERNLHVIYPAEGSVVRMGRGQQCEVRVTDISVSRYHAEMRFKNGKFYIRDNESKFGTLLKFRESFNLQEGAREFMRLQYGRSLFDFELSLEQKTSQDLLQQQRASLPIFYTQAQLRQMNKTNTPNQRESQ